MLFNAASFEVELEQGPLAVLCSGENAHMARESGFHNHVLRFAPAEAEHPLRNVHLNVFKAGRSETIRETARVNNNHRVEQV
jgi:hypothetical protein